MLTLTFLFLTFIFDKEENCRTFVSASSYQTRRGNLPHFRGRHFYACSCCILYGGSVPPCRMLMHLLPGLVKMQRERRNRSYFIENLRLPPYS